MDVREIQPGETGSAFLAMKELRTNLADEEAFVRQVDSGGEGWVPRYSCGLLARRAASAATT
jgi:hypothetical protein